MCDINHNVPPNVKVQIEIIKTKNLMNMHIISQRVFAYSGTEVDLEQASVQIQCE